jgi:ligand-binding sensor domain-containing protein
MRARACVRRLVLVALIGGVLVGCSDEGQQSAPAVAGAPASAAASPASPPPAPLRVLEQFEVGPTAYVRALAVEPAANALWVGTSVGVHEVDLGTREVRQTFTREQGLANEYVFSIGIDSQGHKWFGTNAGGVSRYRDGEWRTYFPMHGLADYWVYSFAEQADGLVWLGTWEGASRFDPATGEFTNFVEELVNEWVYGIDIDASGRVWFATEGGVSMLDGETWRAWSHAEGLGAQNQDGLPPSRNTGLGTRSRHDLGTLRGGLATYNPSYVFAIHVDPQGVVWAGTWGGGVSRFDGERWENLTAAEGLAGNIVYSITQESGGAIWFGTNRGASRLEGDTWQSIGRNDGLIDDHVYALVVAPDGDVWAGTRGGVVRIGR